MSTCPPYAPFFGFAGVASSSDIPTSSFSSVAVGSLELTSCRRRVWDFESRNRDCRSGAIQARVDHESLSAHLTPTRFTLSISDTTLCNYQSLIPVVMSGIIAVYGLVVSVLIAGGLDPTQEYSLFAGFIHLGAGLACGFTGLAAGYAIGIVGDSCVRAYVYESRVFVAMVLILIFAEVLGLYGYVLVELSSMAVWTHHVASLIVALIMNTKASDVKCS
ncbi:hypothetical protein EW146_g9883 [Bondarzewia mesenterica]|uniref:V-type proton ATPase proteolipid subunit n=1 Tax=Bondarzewia mesenterica TaxID=1095465 RepID=A0A4S4L2F0_9AGAM|nr:hypothetical protein EW146_g9883 [Bondarzewia mesenterica]